MQKSLPEIYYSSLPDSTQTLLLKACLMEKEEALKNWKEWIHFNQYTPLKSIKTQSVLPQVFDNLDFGSQRLLPLLYKRMTMAGIQDPLINELKGYYRYVWVRNQLLKKELLEVTTLFAENNIQNVVIKGFALLESIYKDPGIRPVLDLDIAVHPESWSKAISILKEYNWNFKFPQHNSDLIHESLDHAIHLIKDQGEIDLHIKFLHMPLPLEVQDEFWASAKLYLPNHYGLKTEHQILSILEHGYQGNEKVSLRAIADLVYIIRNTSIDWNSLIKNIITIKLTIPAITFFEYIVREKFVEVPKTVLSQIKSVSITQPEFRYFKLVTSASPPNGFKEFRLKFYWASMLSTSRIKKIRIIINTYKYQWGVKTTFGVGIAFLWVIFDKLIAPKKKIQYRTIPFITIKNTT